MKATTADSRAFLLLAMQNAELMEQENVTAGDLCDDAQTIYEEHLRMHTKKTTENISAIERQKQDFIREVLEAIADIQAWTLYAALLEKDHIPPHHSLTFNKCALLNDQGPYLDVILGKHPSRYIYHDIQQLRDAVRIETSYW